MEIEFSTSAANNRNFTSKYEKNSEPQHQLQLKNSAISTEEEEAGGLQHSKKNFSDSNSTNANDFITPDKVASKTLYVYENSKSSHSFIEESLIEP